MNSSKTKTTPPKYRRLHILLWCVAIVQKCMLWCDTLFLKNKLPKTIQPLFLLSPPRSGSSFLHRFLIQNTETLQAVTLFDMFFPSLSMKMLIRPFSTLLRKIPFDTIYNTHIHRTGLEFPESDDIALLLQYQKGFLAWIYFFGWKYVPRSTIFEKKFLQQCEQPRYISYIKKIYSRIVGTSKNPILGKSFGLLFNIDALMQHFPQAKFLILIRNPLESIPSFISLEMEVQKRIGSFDALSPGQKMRYYTFIYHSCCLLYKRLHEIYTTHNKNKNFLFITHAELREKFKEALNTILLFYDIEKTSSLQEAIERQGLEQKSFKSQHTYSLEKFGLSEEKIRKDLSFMFTHYQL